MEKSILFRFLPLVLLFVLFFNYLICFHLQAAEEPAGVPEKLTVAFYDLPNVNALGFIMAKERGYYEAAGLPEIEFLWQDEAHTVFEHMEKDASIGVSWLAEGIQARAEGSKVVGLGRLSRGYSNAISIRRDWTPTLTNFDVLDGRKIGLSFRRDLSARVFFQSRGIKIHPIVFRPDRNVLFRKGGVDAIVVVSYNFFVLSEYVRGRDLFRNFKLSDYGGGYPEDTVFCRESFYEENPELCRAFMDATFRGWAYTFSHKEEAVQALVNYQRAYQLMGDTYILERELVAWESLMDLNPELGANGECGQEDYERLCRDMVKSGVIGEGEVPEYDTFFRINLHTENVKEPVVGPRD